MSDKNPKNEKPNVHKDLEGFNIKINSFGEIESSLNTDKLNEFLDENEDEKDESGEEE